MTHIANRRPRLVGAGFVFAVVLLAARLNAQPEVQPLLAVPHSCLWTFPGGVPASSTSCTPPAVTWSSSGTKSVTLKACLLAEPTKCTSITKNLVISSPTPTITGVAITPPPPNYVGDTLTLTATAAGKPPLQYSWAIQNGPTLTGNPVAWSTTGQTAGTRSVRLTVSNSFGSQIYYAYVALVATAPAITSVTIGPNPAAIGSTVALSATATGKGTLTYKWVIAGGPTLTGNPVNWSTVGQTAGNRLVTLTVSSSYGVTQTTRTLTLQEQLVTSWTPNCTDGVCILPVPSTVGFSLVTTQTPTLYEYDWDGNGTYEQSSPVPVASHTYGVLGIYTPRLRVTRGATTQIVTLGVPIVIVGSGSVCSPISSAANFYTVTPCRLVDTRNPVGSYGGPSLSVSTTRVFSFAGRCGIPSSAKALAINVTDVSPSSDGFLSFGIGVCANTVTSSLSFKNGVTRANNAIVPVSNDNTCSINVTPTMSGTSSTVHLIVDVVGYFQ